jgi:hypothetical protein
MMPNIKKKRREIIVTFAMFGVAINKAWTATFRPSFLAITLRGLKTLTSLKTLNIYSFWS